MNDFFCELQLPSVNLLTPSVLATSSSAAHSSMVAPRLTIILRRRGPEHATNTFLGIAQSGVQFRQCPHQFAQIARQRSRWSPQCLNALPDTGTRKLRDASRSDNPAPLRQLLVFLDGNPKCHQARPLFHTHLRFVLAHLPLPSRDATSIVSGACLTAPCRATPTFNNRHTSVQQQPLHEDITLIHCCDTLRLTTIAAIPGLAAPSYRHPGPVCVMPGTATFLLSVHDNFVSPLVPCRYTVEGTV